MLKHTLLQDICEKYGMRLLIDEVQTGGGSTGDNFSCLINLYLTTLTAPLEL